jgi:TolB-like protein
MSATLSADAIKLNRRKSKVRSAWISFIGRIVAQIVGAIASVTLGLLVLTKYGLPEKLPKVGAIVKAAATSRPADHKTPPADHKTTRPAGELALAVLPIQNYSQDAAHTYLADGVTEALTTELAQIPGLRVTSRTSSMAYKGTSKSLPEIARELDVDVILEGSVVRDQDVVRVTAQLIDAGTDRHLWARSYDRSVRSLLPAQAELARSIVLDVLAVLTGRGLPPLP